MGVTWYKWGVWGIYRVGKMGELERESEWRQMDRQKPVGRPFSSFHFPPLIVIFPYIKPRIWG